MEEVWKEVIGTNGEYKVSNLGNVKSFRSKRHERILKCQINTSGYLKTEIYINGYWKTVRIHRLIALYFIDNPNNYKVVNHINGVKTDNRI